MFEREKSKVLELTNGILVPHESRRTIKSNFLYGSTELTIEWPNTTIEDAKNHLTDGTESAFSKVINRSRIYSCDYVPDGSGIVLPLGVLDGSIKSQTIVGIPGFSLNGVPKPPKAHTYEQLIAELEHARENPYSVTVLELQS